jgi:hypothetical protein
VQTKAIAYPTDGHLMLRVTDLARRRCGMRACLGLRGHAPEQQNRLNTRDQTVWR